MSLDPQTAQSSNEPDLKTIAAKLDGLDAKVASAIRGSRTRNMLTLIAGVVSVLLIGYWLAYAHTRFTSEVNPDLMASLGQSYLG